LIDVTYTDRVPKLWSGTIEAHRAAVRDATIDATAKLVAEQGIGAVTMSRVAEETGIGRATLYKYFPDVEAILLAWHERQITDHLHQLAAVGSRSGSADARLEAVLEAYARINRKQPGTQLSGLLPLLHQGDHVKHAHGHLRDFIEGLITEGAAAGVMRDDVPPGDLADYCLHAISAARQLPSEAAARRLVQVIMTGLRADGP
jgi:AcrR family transcriptional regulator